MIHVRTDGIRTALWAICWFSIGMVGVAHAAEVTVTLLDGTSRSGELVSLSTEGVDLTTENGQQHLAADDLMQVEFPSVESGTLEVSPLTVSLADGSVLLLSQFESDGTTATLSASDSETPAIRVPVRQVSDVRLAPLDEPVASAWEDLRNRNARDDLLVIRKGDVLDYVAGSVGKITAQDVTILVRGKELSAPRERIFGLIYASRAKPDQSGNVAVRTQTGDLIHADSLSFTGDQLQLTAVSLGEFSIPIDQLKSIDYGGGRIRFLADLPFDQSASRSPREDAPVVWFVCRNAPSGSGGQGPLVIGDQEYRRGLWLHSGAVLRYRLNREFTQLRAVAGFERTHIARMPRFDPRVRLVILGDSKELYAKEFLWSDPPEPLDLDLTDVRELTIRVDSAGAGQGTLEHFALGDAQVIQ